jgi:hypothetical protein
MRLEFGKAKDMIATADPLGEAAKYVVAPVQVRRRCSSSSSSMKDLLLSVTFEQPKAAAAAVW